MNSKLPLNVRIEFIILFPVNIQPNRSQSIYHLYIPIKQVASMGHHLYIKHPAKLPLNEVLFPTFSPINQQNGSIRFEPHYVRLPLRLTSQISALPRRGFQLLRAFPRVLGFACLQALLSAHHYLHKTWCQECTIGQGGRWKPEREAVQKVSLINFIRTFA